MVWIVLSVCDAVMPSEILGFVSSYSLLGQQSPAVLLTSRWGFSPFQAYRRPPQTSQKLLWAVVTVSFDLQLGRTMKWVLWASMLYIWGACVVTSLVRGLEVVHRGVLSMGVWWIDGSKRVIHLPGRRKVIEDVEKQQNALIEMISPFCSRSGACWFSSDPMLGPTALFINAF